MSKETSVSPAIQEKVNTLMAQASILKLPGLVFGFRAGEQFITHFGNVKPSEASGIVIALFQSLIKTEVANHPEYSDKFRAIFFDLDNDFRALIQNHNQKINTYLKKHKNEGQKSKK